ncbi:MAG: hypothetical protein ACRDRI_03980 [Pseudonocardiaceae bacterium]
MLGVEGAFDVGPEANGAFGAFPDEDAAALPGDDESFFPQLAQGVLLSIPPRTVETSVVVMLNGVAGLVVPASRGGAGLACPPFPA